MFTPLILDNAISYGTVGIVLVVESWLIGAGFVVFGGALVGHWFHEHHWSTRGGRKRVGRRRPPPRS
ncbi:Ribonuclease BN OS=Streptomyces fumanus OX=67302 GN=GCM10018772_18560 PE=4 SV=1 [Streptomyces fumanus]